MIKKTIVWYLCVLIILAASLTVKADDTTKVLFIGNSYTQGNNLTNLFKQLSSSGGKLVFADKSAFGGYRASMSPSVSDGRAFFQPFTSM